jgi:XTP/dITP diphosphohydrolase
MITLAIATRNAHKIQEIRQILGANFRCLPLNDFPAAPAVVEDAPTFAGNAAKKAVSLAEWLARERGLEDTPWSVLADDSGLEVDALHGAPGVHSARFAAGDAPGIVNTPDAANNAKLLRLLEGVAPDQRGARFRCVLALLRGGCPPDQVVLFEGVCEGRVSEVASGRGGFGYDPLFVPAGFSQSFAELGEEQKNQLSHRARALARLKLFLDGGTD